MKLKTVSKNKRFWDIRAHSSGKPPELILYDSIASYSWFGDEVTPKEFADELDALGDVPEIIVRINSPGGCPYAATAIYTRLKNHSAKITCIVDGVAASAATIVCMAADTVKIPAAGQFMIHDPVLGLCGYYSYEKLKTYASSIKTTKNAMINAYAAKSGKSHEEISRLMKKETWYTGQEAVAAGFCDEVLFGAQVGELDMAAFACELARYKNVPQELLKQPAGGASSGEFIQEGNKRMEIKTADELRAKFPELVNEVYELAVTGERSRIQTIERLAVKGFETATNEAKFEKPASPETFAISMFAKIKKQGSDYLAGIQEDIQASGITEVCAGGQEGGFSQEQENPYEKAIDNVLPAREGD